MDGYHKLKPYGFPIHGAIDGFSRKSLWLEVSRSNNSPENDATYFSKTVKELEGCPVRLITDLGTEIIDHLETSKLNFSLVSQKANEVQWLPLHASIITVT